MPTANSVPKFIDSFILGMAQISTANTNRNGTGTLGTVVTGAAQGTLIELIRVVAAGTTTVGVVRLFIDDGTNIRLYAEVMVGAITPTTSEDVFSGEVIPTKPLVLPANYVLKAGTHNAETFNVIATGGNY